MPVDKPKRVYYLEETFQHKLLHLTMFQLILVTVIFAGSNAGMETSASLFSDIVTNALSHSSPRINQTLPHTTDLLITMQPLAIWLTCVCRPTLCMVASNCVIHGVWDSAGPACPDCYRSAQLRHQWTTTMEQSASRS